MGRLTPAVLGTLFLATTGVAEPRRTIGLLTCTLKEGTRDGPENMLCGFARSAGPAPDEKYAADVRGLALLSLGKQVLIWSVSVSATTKPISGFLAQKCARQKAPGHAPLWVGQKNPAITLQFESHGSAELGSGIETIVLKIATTSV
jgi:hypothetical protein